MPTYQYACVNADCGNRFELVQSFTDPAASECPVCGQPVRKVYGSVGVVFKGSGFYRTDSRKAEKSEKSAANAEFSSSAPAKPAAPSTSSSKSASTDAASSTSSSTSTTVSTGTGGSSSAA